MEQWGDSLTFLAQKIDDTARIFGQNLKLVGDLAFTGLKNGAVELGGFGYRVKIGSQLFLATIFDEEPTRIYDVRVAALTPTSATIFWRTNHPATSKVNYGLSTSYGLDVYSSRKVTEHRLNLEDLLPGQTYFFEVLSQNKNVTFDAYYTFTTPAE